MPFEETFFIIKPGAIGDVLHMTPVASAIKKKRPRSKCLFLVGDSGISELLFNNPSVDEIIVFKKGRGIGEAGRVFKLAKALRLKGIDWVINYQPSNWRWRLLCLLLKPKGIIKYKKQKNIKAGEKLRHAAEDHLFTISGLGIDDHEFHPEFFLTDQEIGYAQGLIREFFKDIKYRGIIGLNMGASHKVNRWPVSSFLRLNSLLTSSGFITILTGGSEDRILAERFFGFEQPRSLDCVGYLSIRQTAAIISICDVFVSGDTGPLHLAVSVGTRVIGLFGPADPRRTGPIGKDHIVFQSNLPCVPCRKRKCKFVKTLYIGNRKDSKDIKFPPDEGMFAPCMESIKPDDVALKIEEMF
ncbi:glycosyltransferase family 9 protein [bacterium]|nr:glycosyltransferase family 9 protein [bacterium]